MPQLKYGSTREVHLATLASPSVKFTFQVRDDAFAKTGIVFGRTVRTGDPINLGPGSGWRQLSWEGGAKQRVWRDAQMFDEGSADVHSRTGKIRLWPGFAHIQKSRTRKFDSYAVGVGGAAPAFGSSALYFGERNMFYTGGTPQGGFQIYKYNPVAGGISTLATTVNTLGTRGYTAIVPSTDAVGDKSILYIGTLGGLWLFDEAATTFTKDNGAPATGVNFDTLVCYKDAAFYGSKSSLYKRVGAAGFAQGTHTVIKNHTAANAVMGLCVHNNRLWYGVQYNGNRVAICTSDGVTASQAFEMPGEFVIQSLVSHYGALYIFGGKPQAVPGGSTIPATVGEVWRYSGSSLTKLWESNDDVNSAARDGKAHLTGAATAFGSLLMWGCNGFDGTATPRTCVMCYDPESDAIFEGPGIEMDPAGKSDGMALTTVHAYDNSVVVGYHDFHAYSKEVDFVNGLALLRTPEVVRHRPNFKDPANLKGRSVEYVYPTRRAFVKSSVFRGDDDEQTESKVWLSIRLNIKVPSKYTRLRVYAILNEASWELPSGSEPLLSAPGGPSPQPNTARSVLVGNISYDEDNTGFRAVTLPMKANGGGDYLQSEAVQYAVVLENNASHDVENSDNPEVDSVEVQYMVAPQRRFQWRLRFVLQDGQKKFDGSANALTTAQAMADKLAEFWSSRVPFKMWGPTATSSSTGLTPVEVLPLADSFQVSEYRLDDAGTEVAQEVTLTLVENVT